jgi:hypothetical protein
LSQSQLTRRFEEKVDHKRKLQSYSGPMLVMHTRNDTLVKVSNAERLHAWGGGPDKRLEIFEWGHHNSILHVNAKDYARAFGALVKTVGENAGC